MECNVVVPGYMRPGRGILESDEILAKDNQRDQLIESSHIGLRIIFRGRSSSDAQIAQLLHESEKLTDNTGGLSNSQSAANHWPKRLGSNPQVSADITPRRNTRRDYMQPYPAGLFVADKKINCRRCRLKLLPALATYANGNGPAAIGGEAGDFLLSLSVISRPSQESEVAKLVIDDLTANA